LKRSLVGLGGTKNQNMEFLKEANGRYLSQGYYIEVKSPDDFTDLNRLAKENKPVFMTFFHEYMHFLQDITTTFGLIGMQMQINKIVLLQKVIASKAIDTSIKLPIEIEKSEILNKEVETYKFICGTSKISKSKILRVTNITYKKFNDQEIPLIEYTNYNGSYENFIFGADCIKESMAFIMQSAFDDDYVPESDVPYYTVQKISKYVLPDHELPKHYLAYICEHSLMTLNPGKTFVNSLIKIQESESKLNDISELRVLIEDGSNNEGYKDALENYQSIINTLLKSEHFDEIKKWLIRSMKLSLEIRRKSPFLMTAIIFKSKGPQIFSELIDEIGIPFLINRDGIAVSHIKAENYSLSSAEIDTENQTYLFFIIAQILNHVLNQNLFDTQNTNCRLYNFCKNKGVSDIDDITGELCKTPWLKLKSNNSGLFCPYEIGWKLLGLDKYDIQH